MRPGTEGADPRVAGHLPASPPCRVPWIGLSILIGLAAVGFGTGIRPLLSPDPPIFGDLGGHMVPIRESMEALRQGSFRGWSFSWFGGFPRFYFYFPLPALLIAGLSALIGLGHASVVVVLVGPALLPLAAAGLARSTGGTRGGAVLIALGTGVFLLFRSLALAGGTLEAAVVGEFSYGMSVTLGIFYLASLPGLMRRPGAGWFILSSVLLAATALSHVLGTAVAVIGSVALVGRGRDLLRTAGTWAAGFLLSAWWTVPFLWYAGEMGRLSWSPIATRELAALLYEGVPVGVLALLALGWRTTALGPRFYRVAGVFMVTGIIPLVVPDPPFYPGRLLPFGLWAGCSLAVVAGWQSVLAMAARRRRVRAVIGIAGLGALLVVAAASPPPRRTAEVNFGGMREAVDAAAWLSLERYIQRLPPGAVAEASLHARNTDPPRFLADGGLLHLHRLTGHRTVGGTWQESSRRSAFELRARGNLRGDLSSRMRVFPERPPDPDLGIRQARLLGARYLVMSGPAAALDTLRFHGVRELARDSSWRLYEIAGAAAAVGVARVAPTARDSFSAAAAAWFERGGGSPLPVRIDSALAPRGSAFPGAVRLGEAQVRLGPRDITLRGAVPGQPLLVRLSFFPNWRLATPGRGPFRAAPNDMLVLPLSSEVRLVWVTGWPERASLATSWTAAALLLLALAAGMIRRSHTRGPAHAPAASPPR